MHVPINVYIYIYITAPNSGDAFRAVVYTLAYAEVSGKGLKECAREWKNAGEIVPQIPIGAGKMPDGYERGTIGSLNRTQRILLRCIF